MFMGLEFGIVVTSGEQEWLAIGRASAEGYWAAGQFV